jgi:hypothetical protein
MRRSLTALSRVVTGTLAADVVLVPAAFTKATMNRYWVPLESIGTVTVSTAHSLPVDAAGQSVVAAVNVVV